jgi:glycine cleavage system aminomethyltransferase T
MGLIRQAETSTAGRIILYGVRVVGCVTSGEQSLTFKCGIGLVRFNELGDCVGKLHQFDLADRTQHACEVVDLAFF